MCLVKICLKPAKKLNREKLDWLAEDYIIFLQRNGQIISEEVNTAWQGGVYTIYAELPRPDSLERKYNSEWVQERLHTLEEYLGGPVAWSIQDDQIPRRFPSLGSSTFLYLHSGIWIDSLVPVHRGNDGKDIPLYLLPIDQNVRQEICGWSSHSLWYEYLWFHSGALEIPAYRQLGDSESQHGKNGRELCQKIETATNIPTYYYLKRHWGRKQGEGSRLCPVCGKQWDVKNIKSNQHKFWHFDFMCVSCRIVSHIADNNDDERHARIGEYRKGNGRP